MTEAGETLETVRISHDPEYLRAVMARAGEAPEVVLEATYGWYWAADTLAELGAHVHLAHPLGVKMFSYRRVKNDARDAADLADLLRMVGCPRPGSRLRRHGSCAAGCGIGRSWSGCART
jgi:transposase